jgi:hypothetical protein
VEYHLSAIDTLFLLYRHKWSWTQLQTISGVGKHHLKAIFRRLGLPMLERATAWRR